MDNLLSPEEVKHFLEVDDPAMDRLIRQEKLHAFKLGGTYLRFRKDEVLSLKHEIRPTPQGGVSISWTARLRNFWRFNNFYILSFLLIVVLLFFAVRS